MRRAMAREAVAAGLGAFSTCRLVGVQAKVKSSTMRAVGADRLGAHPRRTEDQLVGTHLGHVALKLLDEGSLDDITPHLWAPVRQ